MSAGDVSLAQTTQFAKREDSENDEWARTMETLREEGNAGKEREHAHSLFEHLDVDGDRKVCAWELARFFPSEIGCSGEDKIELVFFCQTLGLTVEEDEEGMVVIAGWEEDSAAAEHPSLMTGMRILSIDGWDLPCALAASAKAGASGGNGNGAGVDGRFESSLRKCERILESLNDVDEDDVLHVLEVAMPAVVVKSSNTWLDMDVNGDVVAVSVPEGVYATKEAYFSALQDAGRDQHPRQLANFGVKFDPAQPFVVLTAGYSPFRILWRSGEHRSQNCRRLFYSSADKGSKDTEVQMSYTSGRWDTFALDGTTQRLKLKPGALTDFAEHLILEVLEARNSTAVDGPRATPSEVGVEGVSLEFEEFCTLYAAYLSSQEGLRRARDLVMMGFMGKEEFAEIVERQAMDDQRRRRLRKMLRARKTNKERKRQQLARKLLSTREEHATTPDHNENKRRAPSATTEESATPSFPAKAQSTTGTTSIGGEREEHSENLVAGGAEGGAGVVGGKEGATGGDVVVVEGASGHQQQQRSQDAVNADGTMSGRMAHLLLQRDRSKAIKRAQQKAKKAKLLATTNETKKFEAELDGAGGWGASKRSVELAKLGLEDCRSSQAGKRPQPEDIHPAFLGYFHRKRSIKEAFDPAVRSPVFFGTLSGPLTRLETVRGEGSLVALRMILNGAAFANGLPSHGSPGTSHTRAACLTFPLAPTTRGKVRQRLREVGIEYDKAALVHPSCFGLMTIPDNQDCRHQSPVFFGYDLAKKPRSRAGALAEDEMPRREDFVAHRKGRPCPVCLVGKPGCPCCWEFPEGFVPHDFAYLGPFEDTSASRPASRRNSRPTSVDGGGADSVCSFPTLGSAASPSRVTDGGGSTGSCPAGGGVLLLTDGVKKGARKKSLSGSGRQQLLRQPQEQRLGGEGGGRGEEEAEVEAREKPELHTDLTTSAAITLYRSIVGRIIRIFVKVIPCGTATCLWMDSSWPVSYLYDLWRANSAEGNTLDAFMCLPTMTGQWKLDNRNLPETDTTLGVYTGDLPLSRYNLTTPKSTVTVLCTTFLSELKTKENIERYLVYETGIGKHAVLEVFNHLVGCPKHPEDDPIQKVLCGLMEYRTAQQERVDGDDDSAEVEKRNRLLLDAEKARKEAALAEKRKKVAYGSKEWKATQRALREEAAAADAALLAAGNLGATQPGAHTINEKNSGEGGAKTERGGGGGVGKAKGFAGRAATSVGGKLSKLNLSFKASKKTLF